MPKIKRLKLREKLWKRFSDSLIDFAESLPSAQRGPLSWLQRVRREHRFTKNMCPPGVSLDLESLWICEIIPIEQFEKQIPGIMRLISDHKTTRFLPQSERPKDTLARLRGFKETVLGTSWHNFYLLDCLSYSKKIDVDYITFEMEVFSGGHVAVYIRIVPNEKFHRKIRSIFHTEYESDIELFPPGKLKYVFRRWGWRSSPGDTKKRNDLQSTIVALKDSTKTHLQQYFSGLLFKPGYMLPSIELWLKETPSEASEEKASTKMPYKTFWDSVGFPERSMETYKDDANKYALTLPERDLPDYSIKILCDKSKIEKSSGYDSLNSQISYEVNDWVPTLISLWSLRSLYRDYIDESSFDKIKILGKMMKLSSRQTFRWTRIFLAREAQFKRLQKDLALSDHNRNFSFNVPDFKKTIFKHTTTLQEDLIGNTTYLQKKCTDILSSTQQLLKATTEANIISANHFTQITNLGLSVMMFLLSILMLAVGVLAIGAKPKLCEAPKFAPACQWVDDQFIK